MAHPYFPVVALRIRGESACAKASDFVPIRDPPHRRRVNIGTTLDFCLRRAGAGKSADKSAKQMAVKHSRASRPCNLLDGNGECAFNIHGLRRNIMRIRQENGGQVLKGDEYEGK